MSSLADSLLMDVSGAAPVAQAVAIRMEKVAQNAMKAEGEGAVALIEQAKAPPAPTEHQGTKLNTYG